MKLLCLNVGMFEENNSKLKKLLTEVNPDIIALQEVTKRIEAKAKDEFVSLDALDAASEKLTHAFFAPIWVLSAFDKHNFHAHEHFSFDLGGQVEFGQYIKSAFPIVKAQNVFVQNHFTYVTDWSNWPQEDYRAVQVTDLQLPNTTLRILNYHGIWSKDKKGTEKTFEACKIIHTLANEVEYPSIICGDFNLFPDTQSMAVFTKHRNLLNEFKISTTRPESNELSDQQRNVVDYILVSEGIQVTDFQVLDSDASDHLPLLIEFEV